MWNKTYHKRLLIITRSSRECADLLNIVKKRLSVYINKFCNLWRLVNSGWTNSIWLYLCCFGTNILEFWVERGHYLVPRPRNLHLYPVALFPFTRTLNIESQSRFLKNGTVEWFHPPRCRYSFHHDIQLQSTKSDLTLRGLHNCLTFHQPQQPSDQIKLPRQ